MKNNVAKIKSVIPQRIAKAVLWALILLMLIRGAGSFFRKNDVQQAQKLISEFVKTKEHKSKIEFEASSFARSFAFEFFTLDGSNMDDYLKRLRPYVPSYLEMSIPLKSGVKEEALTADALRIAWVSENQVNVDVKVKIRYTYTTKSQDSFTGEVEEAIETIVRDSYIRVPVTEIDGYFLVDDYPAFIPEPEKANAEYMPYAGKSTDPETTKAIEITLGNFFKTYYNGNSGEILYYLNNSLKPIKGLEGRYEFVKLDSVNVYELEDTSRYAAIVSLTVKDSVNGQNLPQKYHAVVIKKDGRFYIDMFDIRTSNLSNFF